MAIQPAQDDGRTALMVVAHPDDEVIWCGGLLLTHPHWQWHILTLCRADDGDRAPKFARVCRRLGAGGAMDCGSHRRGSLLPAATA